MHTQITNDMLGKSKPNPKIINMTTLMMICRPFTIADRRAPGQVPNIWQ
jgi:hypothetical protein